MRYRRARRFISILPTLLALMALCSCAATGPSVKAENGPVSKLVKIETRPGVAQKFIHIKPENPVASVILLAGGQGDLQLSELWGTLSVGWGQNIFVVRSREVFANHGLMVALVDTPSDKRSYEGEFQGLNSLSDDNEVFRASEEHAQDIAAVAAYLKKEADIPVWVIGTSWGTFSAANAAIRIKPGIEGLVLTSSLTRCRRRTGKLYNYYPNGILNLNLDQVTVPTLILAHQSDRCFFTPPNKAPQIKDALTNSRKVEVQYVSGGLDPLEKACEGLSAHGFYGIEENVVASIADFITKSAE